MTEGHRHAQQAHSWASFTPEGVDDAKRARPAVSLEGFAAARGLEYRDSLRWGHLIAVVPQWAGRVAGACIGPLAPHRYGIVAHELLQVGYTPSESGGYVGGLRGDFHGLRLRDPWLGLIDVVTGGVSDMLSDDGVGPFPRHHLAVPTTSVALHVPEAALVPRFGVGCAHRMPKHQDETGRWGLPGFRLRSQLDDEQKTTVLGGPTGQQLSALAARSYAELRVVNSQLRVTVDGFVTDERELDWLIGRAVAIADALAWTESALLTPAPFDAPLPAAPAPVRVEPQTKFKLGRIKIGFGKPLAQAPGTTDPDGWGAVFAAAARDFGLRYEDPAAFHRTFPRVQVPGTARGVLSGRLPSGIDGRLTVHQHDLLDADGRAAVTFPAPAGTPDTPPGGVPHEPTDMRLAVTDGLVTCWERRRRRMAITPDETSRRAADTARALGY